MATSTDNLHQAVFDQIEADATCSRAWHGAPAVLHELVRAQARRTPDSIAFVYEDQWISYSQLVALSGSWACHLRRLGVGVGTLVGICLERTVDLPAIVLAVLEAGGVCVPLEPSDPAPRVAAMIRETEPSVIVTQRRWRHHLPPTSVPVVVVDEETPPRARALETRASRPTIWRSVLLTSGSTAAYPRGSWSPTPRLPPACSGPKAIFRIPVAAWRS